MIKRTKKMHSDTLDITVFTAALLLVMTMCSLGMFFQTANELFGTTLALSFTVSLAVLFTAGVDLVFFDDREDELLYVMRRFCSGFGWFGKAQKYIKRAALSLSSTFPTNKETAGAHPEREERLLFFVSECFTCVGQFDDIALKLVDDVI